MWVEAVLTFSIILNFPLNFIARLHGARVWFEKKELKTRLIYRFPSLDRWISKSLPLHPRPKNENEQSSMENHQASPISQALIIVDISLLTIGSLAGVFGNGRACVLCWKHKDLYKVPHVLFVNLSLYCFLTCESRWSGICRRDKHGFKIYGARIVFFHNCSGSVCLHNIKRTHVITEGDKQTRLCNTPFRSAHDATQCQKDYSRVLDSRDGFGLSRCHLWYTRRTSILSQFWSIRPP